MVTAPLIITVTESARRLSGALAEKLGADEAEGTGTMIAGFRDGRPIIAICAAGIVIRKLAPYLLDKTEEPPVVAVSETGSVAVPLLGGHRGANRLARQVAELTGGTAAITTASDLRLGVALDDPPPGFILTNPEHHKAFAAALLEGASVRLIGEAPWLEHMATGSEDAPLTIRVSERDLPGNTSELIYAPRVLTIGIGSERGVEHRETADIAARILGEHRLSRHAIAGVFSLDLKADEPAIAALAAALGTEARFFSREELQGESHRLENPSEIVLREVGVAGVAEAAALAAAGPQGQLIVAKQRSARATCAIALAPQPITTLPGRKRGRLSIVGIGPGAPATRSPAATAALRGASDWVGYGLYLDLVADLAVDQVQHRYPLGAEAERVRTALTLAATGREVALICSGDAAIYAMASLAAEILDPASPSAAEPACQRIELIVIPGISAFQSASAAAGALIGHDFCCISLSDLLTPWSVIDARVRAAAIGDFVTAFYNPRSAGRSDHLARALALMKAQRPPDTPVLRARSLGREEESTALETLDKFDPDSVDMLTVVIVGARSSRMYRRGDGRLVAYTPRGYVAQGERA